mmetsp:Transcript_4240/g.5692  ORF Transcript_4240/g.5692 Transcript_4240/m.5692 type:complete len:172 (+) Transcript_4240:122-637(+)
MICVSLSCEGQLNNSAIKKNIKYISCTFFLYTSYECFSSSSEDAFAESLVDDIVAVSVVNALSLCFSMICASAALKFSVKSLRSFGIDPISGTTSLVVEWNVSSVLTMVLATSNTQSQTQRQTRLLRLQKRQEVRLCSIDVYHQKKMMTSQEESCALASCSRTFFCRFSQP